MCLPDSASSILQDLLHNDLSCYLTSSSDFVVNYLNRATSAEVPAGAAPEFGRVDINGDGFVTPLDALIVINDLNSPDGEGENLQSEESSNPVTQRHAASAHLHAPEIDFGLFDFDDDEERKEQLLELLATSR